MAEIVFKDRRQAGQKLAEKLLEYKSKDLIVLAIPRGGVVVAYEVAKILGAKLDVIVARKIGAPGQPELAIGAIAPGTEEVLDHRAVEYFGLVKQQIARLVAKEKQEMQRRIALYRGDKSELQLKDRTVIIIDDGLATGLTARAAVKSVKKMGAAKIILAVPVAAADTIAKLKPEVDKIICISAPRDFAAVGYWYQNFMQVTDDEVIALLKNSRF